MEGVWRLKCYPHVDWLVPSDLNNQVLLSVLLRLILVATDMIYFQSLDSLITYID